MNHIHSFEAFNNHQEYTLVNEQISYLLTEKRNLGEIWNSALDIVKPFGRAFRKNMIKKIVLGMLAFYSINAVKDTIMSSLAPEDVKIEAIDALPKKEVFKLGSEYIVSQQGWDFVRSEEGLRLKAYKIGDGKVTVGYGHAQNISDTKLRVGQEISQEQANEYLKEDLKLAANGVRRIFSDWAKEGVQVKITQSMFDALVSMAYNAGVGGLRKSNLMKIIKTGDFEKAAKAIETYKVSKKFRGLKIRRMKEKELFLKDLNKMK